MDCRVNLIYIRTDPECKTPDPTQLDRCETISRYHQFLAQEIPGVIRPRLSTLLHSYSITENPEPLEEVLSSWFSQTLTTLEPTMLENFLKNSSQPSEPSEPGRLLTPPLSSSGHVEQSAAPENPEISLEGDLLSTEIFRDLLGYGFPENGDVDWNFEGLQPLG